MAIQISAAFTALLELKKDLSDVPQATFVRWCDYVNKFMYRFALGCDTERYIKETSLTTISGVNSYALPADFRDMSHFGTGIFFMDQQNPTAPSTRVLPHTSYGSAKTGFYLKGGNLMLTPYNWQSSQPFTIRYIPKQTALTDVTQYFTTDGTATGAEIIPDEFLDMLVKALDNYYSIWDENLGQESYSDERFSRDLDDFAKEIYREANSYYLEDNSVYY